MRRTAVSRVSSSAAVCVVFSVVFRIAFASLLGRNPGPCRSWRDVPVASDIQIPAGPLSSDATPVGAMGAFVARACDKGKILMARHTRSGTAIGVCVRKSSYSSVWFRTALLLLLVFCSPLDAGHCSIRFSQRFIAHFGFRVCLRETCTLNASGVVYFFSRPVAGILLGELLDRIPDALCANQICV